MARVGLVGVGNMGMGVAVIILRNGHALSVYDMRFEDGFRASVGVLKQLFG